MVPSELEVTGGDALVDTTVKDAQINELGSMSSHFEGQQNLATPRKLYSVDVLDDKKLQFQTILQLLQLLIALIANLKNQKPEYEHCNNKLSSGASHKSFDYVDALTNLMVRNGEVVAAVACGGWLENRSTHQLNLLMRMCRCVCSILHMFSIHSNSSSHSLHPQTWRQICPLIFTRTRLAHIRRR